MHGSLSQQRQGQENINYDGTPFKQKTKPRVDLTNKLGKTLCNQERPDQGYRWRGHPRLTAHMRIATAHAATAHHHHPTRTSHQRTLHIRPRDTLPSLDTPIVFGSFTLDVNTLTSNEKSNGLHKNPTTPATSPTGSKGPKKRSI